MNKEFKIEITETLVKQVSVRANNKYEALEKAKEMYSKEQIVLDYSDFYDNDFKVVE